MLVINKIKRLMDELDNQMLSKNLEELGLARYNLDKLLTRENGFNMDGDLTQHLLKLYHQSK